MPLTWYEAVRRRPTMYIGDTGQLGLRFLARHLFECAQAPRLLSVVVEGAKLAIRAASVPVSIKPRKLGQPIYLVEIASGLPVPIDDPPSIAPMEVIDRQTNSAVFRRMPVAPSVIAIANALSSEMKLVSYHAGVATEASFKRGVSVSTTTRPSPAQDGLAVELALDPEIFAQPAFLFEDLARELRDFAALRKVAVELRDAKHNVAFATKCTG